MFSRTYIKNVLKASKALILIRLENWKSTRSRDSSSKLFIKVFFETSKVLIVNASPRKVSRTISKQVSRSCTTDVVRTSKASTLDMPKSGLKHVLKICLQVYLKRTVEMSLIVELNMFSRRILNDIDKERLQDVESIKTHITSSRWAQTVPKTNLQDAQSATLQTSLRLIFRSGRMDCI